ncbi:MAG TPA: hypothetical protein VIE65_13560 [Methylobacter sp.]|jgi:hypothetical protein
MTTKTILKIAAGILCAATLSNQCSADDVQQFNPGLMWKCTKIILLTTGIPGTPTKRPGDIVHVNFGPTGVDNDLICNMQLMVSYILTIKQPQNTVITMTEVNRTHSTVDFRLDAVPSAPWTQASSIQVSAYGYQMQ